MPPLPFTLLKEHGTMQAALAPRSNSRTFITHFVGSGLDDDRYASSVSGPKPTETSFPLMPTAAGQRDDANRVPSLFR